MHFSRFVFFFLIFPALILFCPASFLSSRVVALKREKERKENVLKYSAGRQRIGRSQSESLSLEELTSFLVQNLSVRCSPVGSDTILLKNVNCVQFICSFLESHFSFEWAFEYSFLFFAQNRTLARGCFISAGMVGVLHCVVHSGKASSLGKKTKQNKTTVLCD